MRLPTKFTAPVFGLLLVTLLARSAGAIVIASDNASDAAYADGWIATDDGGTGFAPWAGIGSYGAVPTMEIDVAPSETDNDLGAPAFRIGTGGIFGGYIIDRVFDSPMQAGQSFKIDYDAYSITPPGEPGRDILISFNVGPDDSRLSFYAYYYDDGAGTVFGTDFWGVNADTAIDNLAGGTPLPPDPLSGIDWQTSYTTTDSSDGFTLTLDIVTIDTYRLRIVDDNVTKVDVSGQLYSGAPVVGQGIDRVVFYGSETTTGSTEPGGVVYFNNLLIETTAPVGVPGDYNGNGTVDAADYVLWRNGGPLQNEGASTGVVDQADYDFWRTRFGATSGSGSGLGSIAGVPEPGTVALVAGAALACLSRRRNRRM